MKITNSISHAATSAGLMSGSTITLTVGACKIEIGTTAISLNDGIIKVGPAGVSLVNGAMSFGVPP